MISFDEEMAAEFGLNVIIFCNKIADWLKYNSANEKNYYDGRYWTYNTLKALTRLFPFWSVDQLRKVIKDSMAGELIVRGNYNKAGYDQTLWYTLTEKGCKLLKIPMWGIHQMDVGNSPHGSGENPTPIPITSTNKINSNKSFCEKDQKTNKPVDKSKKNMNKKSWTTRQTMKAENETKPAGAEKPKSPFSDPTKHQS